MHCSAPAAQVSVAAVQQLLLADAARGSRFARFAAINRQAPQPQPFRRSPSSPGRAEVSSTSPHRNPAQAGKSAEAVTERPQNSFSRFRLVSHPFRSKVGLRPKSGDHSAELN